MSSKGWESVFKSFAEELEEENEDCWKIEFDDSIVPDQPDHSWFQYRRQDFARFNCSKCKTNTWPSNKVHVVFHYHLNKIEKTGKVKMLHSEQSCIRCKGAKMEKPHFDDNIIEKLLEKLVEKIRIRYYNQEPPTVTYQGTEGYERSKAPHESAHCSFCKMGKCQEADTQ